MSDSIVAELGAEDTDRVYVFLVAYAFAAFGLGYALRSVIAGEPISDQLLPALVPLLFLSVALAQLREE